MKYINQIDFASTPMDLGVKVEDCRHCGKTFQYTGYEPTGYCKGCGGELMTDEQHKIWKKRNDENCKKRMEKEKHWLLSSYREVDNG